MDRYSGERTLENYTKHCIVTSVFTQIDFSVRVFERLLRNVYRRGNVRKICRKNETSILSPAYFLPNLCSFSNIGNDKKEGISSFPNLRVHQAGMNALLKVLAAKEGKQKIKKR
jgi:hypothetical protein